MQVSERAIVQVFERCHELEVVDIVPARWNPAQDLLLWQTVSPLATQHVLHHVLNVVAIWVSSSVCSCFLSPCM